MMKSSDIRKAFIDYFVQHHHQPVASSSLVPEEEKTLLFTNAGMVQFKDTFLGVETRPYSCAVSAQRCVRAGGKHNDLENVGFTARHHTFFEMLGNFSFGDYFKREAITFAWTFLTEILKLPAEKLWITVFADDDETADIWLKEMGVSPARFSRCGEADNFWSMGDTGPCGPCTEIFYDHGESIAGGPPGSETADGDRYIEIWNLVFMQYNRDKAGVLHPLPKPSVDTGMGLERITAVVQGVHNNYDIDSFKALIAAIVALGEGHHLDSPSYKVIADHIRACAFLIADGVTPSNEGRGYVLRRIIRRALRHGNKLHLVTPFFYQLVAPLIDIMGEAYPLLREKQALIERLLKQEEMQFTLTLDQGLALLRQHMSQLTVKQIPGEVAFKLYDTYGFPLDLTADIAREQGFEIDVEGFNQRMDLQRQQSQAASLFEVNYHERANVTEASDFKGYECETLQSNVIAILLDAQKVDTLTIGQKAYLILAETPFYAESGGQVGDKGQILSKSGAVFEVYDTQKMGQAIVHVGEVHRGTFNVGDSVMAHVNTRLRNDIRLNHTATHLLHAALKVVLGNHVEQKGSLVESERARFDFSHFEGLTISELQAIEALVNEKIRDNIEAATDIMDLDAAKQSGAQALFGEKYSDSVRVLSLGDFSKELCGGTHAKRTGDIGLFKITAEYGIASGIRRIEMVTGEHALLYVNEQLHTLQAATNLLKTSSQDLLGKLQQTVLDCKEKEKEMLRLKGELARFEGQTLLQSVTTIGDVKLLVKQVEGVDSQGLRGLFDELKSKLTDGVLVLFTIDNQKMNVIAGVGKSLIGKVPSAKMLVQHLCGKGGGREDMAQGGGVVPADLNEKLSQIASMITI